MRMVYGILALLTALMAAAPAFASMADVVEATYPEYSVGAPTPDGVVICHGFGCRYRTEIGLSAADRANLTRLLSAGRASAGAERRAIAAAWAWFDRRIAPQAGTRNHVASAGSKYMYDRNQFDCIDSSRNTTSLLLVLQQLHLLRHHTVDVPASRGFWIDGKPPHYTAVLRETASGVKWAVDSWTRAYGQPAEVMTLAQWYDG